VFGNYTIRGIEEVVAPTQVSWWPATVGWQLLLAAAILALAWWGVRRLRRWLRNGYRRAAISELRELCAGEGPPDQRLASVARLLKATALAAYPRYEVASLSGADWLRWLNHSTQAPLFDETRARLLSNAVYQGAAVSEADLAGLAGAVERWILDHPGAGGA
jgi:hypothetical protein